MIVSLMRRVCGSVAAGAMTGYPAGISRASLVGRLAVPRSPRPRAAPDRLDLHAAKHCPTRQPLPGERANYRHKSNHEKK